MGAIIFVAVSLYVREVQNVTKRARPPCIANMRQIGLALHLYHADYGSLPPAFTVEDGVPMHSWRALILPYLADLYEGTADWQAEHRYARGLWESSGFREREETARKKAEQIRSILAEYDFSEPWNGPNNLPLADRPLDAFCCPDHGESDAMTDYLTVIGPETAWPEGEVSRFEDFRDGLSNTILVVEVADSGIRWSEPQDLRLESMSFVVGEQNGLGIRGPFPGYANVYFAGGHATSISADLESDEVRALLTIDGQENVSW